MPLTFRPITEADQPFLYRVYAGTSPGGVWPRYGPANSGKEACCRSVTLGGLQPANKLTNTTAAVKALIRILYFTNPPFCMLVSSIDG